MVVSGGDDDGDNDGGVMVMVMVMVMVVVVVVVVVVVIVGRSASGKEGWDAGFDAGLRLPAVARNVRRDPVVLWADAVEHHRLALAEYREHYRELVGHRFGRSASRGRALFSGSGDRHDALAVRSRRRRRRRQAGRSMGILFLPAGGKVVPDRCTSGGGRAAPNPIIGP